MCGFVLGEAEDDCYAGSDSDESVESEESEESESEEEC